MLPKIYHTSLHVLNLFIHASSAEGRLPQLVSTVFLDLGDYVPLWNDDIFEHCAERYESDSLSTRITAGLHTSHATLDRDLSKDVQ